MLSCVSARGMRVAIPVLGWLLQTPGKDKLVSFLGRIQAIIPTNLLPNCKSIRIPRRCEAESGVVPGSL